MQRKQLTKIPRGMLRRKFDAPKLPAGYVEEQQLTSQIFDFDAWRVSLLHAAKGFGKTLLLSQWYHQLENMKGHEPLWMYIDPNDAVGRNFILALCALFQQIDERFALFIDEIYENYPADEDSDSKNKDYLVDIINLLDECCDPSRTYVVMLARCEEASTDELMRMLLFLNKNTGENFRFILSGSYFSPMLDDFLLDSSIYYFDSDALRMDIDQLVQVGRVYLPEASEEDLVYIGERCDGWPMAYEFQAMARMRAKSKVEARKALEGYVRRYFDNFLKEFAPPEIEEFLIKSSIFGRVRVEACDHLLGIENSAELLAYISAHSFFVSQDPEDGSYKYDAYFLSYLRRRLLDQGEDEVKTLASRASSFIDSSELPYEYVRLTALSCDAFFLEQSISSSTNLTRPARAQDFLEYLLFTSPEDFETSFYLAWVSVWSFISLGLPVEVRRSLVHLSTFDLSGLDDACAYIDAICLALEGDCETSLARIRRIQASLGSNIPQGFQCLLLHMEAENCERLGRIKESLELFEKSLSFSERADGTFYQLFDYYMLSIHFMSLGDLDKAVEYARRGIDACKGDVPIKGGLLAIIAQVYLERGDYNEAAEYLDVATNLVSSHMNLDIYLETYITLARYEWLCGSSNKSFAILTELTKLVEGRCIHRNIEKKVSALRAPIAAELGEHSVMREELAKLEAYENSADLLRAVPCYMGHIVSMMLQGEYERALSLIVETREYMRKYKAISIYWTALMYVYESCSFEMLSSHAKAKASLNHAIEIAVQEGYASIFIKGHNIMRDLLLELAASRKIPFGARRYVQNVLTLFKDSSMSSIDDLIYDEHVQGFLALTSREREVLRLLNQGLSRNEISASLHVSQNTVKTHLRNIYSKLGVRTREEAYSASVDQFDRAELEQAG